MKNYWSCSKFADWLRGTMKPTAETSAGWSAWKKQAQQKHPIRYWITEEGLDAIQRVLHWPVDSLYNVKYYINNRWVTKTHALTSSLKKGQWHEYEERVLHCLFDELVNFVEIEQAWSHIAWAGKEERKKYSTPFWASGWFRWRTWRCPQAGVDHLKWASSLVFNENWGTEPDSDNYGEPTHQAIAAREILALYQWWTVYRPMRPDPYDVSGWTELCEEQRRDDPDDFLGENAPQSRKERVRISLDELQTIEDNYEREDEEMMIRLIKVRGSMWT